MSAEVTVTLPDDLWERAQLWATHAGRPPGEFLTEAIELSLLPLGQAPQPTDKWSDEEVLSAADAELSADQDQRLSEILALQREGCISEDQRIELSRLMLRYQEGLLRKAVALREAVRRGLREPLGA